ncbi:terminase gpA endonuclease subunit [Sulfuricurvum sp.]|uniref:terminase gpA endonuclease subunit n=1 Tax=Sulfuricurvum sp. TaxID=2025608 RepID=UPI003562DF7F
MPDKFPPISYDFPIPEHVRNAARFKDKPLADKWSEDNWILTKVYARKGKFHPIQWQRWVINLICTWRVIHIIAPVRMGKTMISDIMRSYCIDVYDMGGMVAYPTKELVESNFKTRIIPSLTEIPVMKKHLTGKSDDLTIKMIILKNSIWNTASAQNRNELAQYGAQFFQGDEVAKWQVVRFDPDALIDGRQKDYTGTNDYRKVYSSSPWEVGDILYKASYKPGSLFMAPHALCPWCHIGFEWSDYHIRENLAKDSKLRKDPMRVKGMKEKAVRYECPNCGKEIPEEARMDMLEHTIWAAPKIEIKDFEQKADKILPDGTVIETEDRSKKDRICVNWSRLLDYNWKFYECLAAFFAALKDPKRMRAYTAEDMGRFPKNELGRRSMEFVAGKRFGYLQYGPDAFIPDWVHVVTFTADTQDNGFFCTRRGWGKNMETWLLWHEFIEAPMDGDAKNKEEVLEIVRPFLEKPLLKKNGTRMHTIFGLIDRGGHRPEYVDYLCDHITWLHPYVGLTAIDYKKPIIMKSESGKSHPKLYVGQTRLLSDRVEGRMGSKIWHLPDDVTDEYLSQLLSQYYAEEIDEHGQVKRDFICLPNDHYRDSENLQEGCALVLELEDKLVSDDYIKRIEENTRDRNKEQPQVEQKKEPQIPAINPLQRNIQPYKKPWLSAIRRH